MGAWGRWYGVAPKNISPIRDPKHMLPKLVVVALQIDTHIWFRYFSDVAFLATNTSFQCIPVG